MSGTDVGKAEKTATNQFWLGISIASLLWALLGIGTVMA